MKKIKVCQVFGIENRVCFLENNEVLYLTGSNIVRLNLDSNKTQIYSFNSRANVEFFRPNDDFTCLIVIENDIQSSFISVIDLKTTCFSVKKLEIF